MTSKQALGLAYELLSVNVLRKQGFSIDHCGRTGDRGIDFRGYWILSSNRFPIIGQCKCHQIKSSPSHIREVEGTLNRIRDSYQDAIGVLVTSAGFTPGAAVHCQTSQLPLLMCQIKQTTIPPLSTTSDNEKVQTSDESMGYISKIVFSRVLKRQIEQLIRYRYRFKENIGQRETTFIEIN